MQITKTNLPLVKLTITVIIVQFFFVNQVNCQVDVIYNPGTSLIEPDSLDENDTIIIKNGFISLFEGKPGRAALYGLLIPGGGQMYNKKYWKIPLAIAIDGGLVYNIYFQNQQYRKYQDAYILALQRGEPSTSINNLREQRNFFRKWREYSWVFFFAGHMFTALDAYVDRHLLEFDIKEDVGFSGNGIKNIPIQGSITLYIPLNHFTKK
jgi:hypothetical protein